MTSPSKPTSPVISPSIVTSLVILPVELSTTNDPTISSPPAEISTFPPPVKFSPVDPLNVTLPTNVGFGKLFKKVIAEAGIEDGNSDEAEEPTPITSANIVIGV